LNETYDPIYVGDFLGNQNVAANFVVVPEPSTLVAGVVGIAGLVVVFRRRCLAGFCKYIEAGNEKAAQGGLPLSGCIDCLLRSHRRLHGQQACLAASVLM